MDAPAVMLSRPWSRHERIGSCDLYLGDSSLSMGEIGPIDAIVSDPPYGISYVHGAEKRTHASKHNEKPIIGDDKPFDPTPFLKWDCLLWGGKPFLLETSWCWTMARLGQARWPRFQRPVGY